MKFWWKFKQIIPENVWKMLAILFQHYCVNTLRPRQDGRHFADDIFKCIFLNENFLIAIKISLKFVPKGPINNIPTIGSDNGFSRRQAIIWTNVSYLMTHICVTRPQWVKIRGTSLREELHTHTSPSECRPSGEWHLNVTACIPSTAMRQHGKFSISRPSFQR